MKGNRYKMEIIWMSIEMEIIWMSIGMEIIFIGGYIMEEENMREKQIEQNNKR